MEDKKLVSFRRVVNDCQPELKCEGAALSGNAAVTLMPEREVYPSGLRLHLAPEEIEELVIQGLEVIDRVNIEARGFIVSKNEYLNGDEKKTYLEIQITDLSITKEGE